jgi:hypothetical protein
VQSDLIDDSSALSPLVRRLVVAAHDDNRRVADLCDAVLRLDWNAATTMAKTLSRRLEPSPKTALPSMQATSDNEQNCA